VVNPRSLHYSSSLAVPDLTIPDALWYNTFNTSRLQEDYDRELEKASLNYDQYAFENVAELYGKKDISSSKTISSYASNATYCEAKLINEKKVQALVADILPKLKKAL